jgi:hypothetical protein
MRTVLVVSLASAVLLSFTACDDGGTTPATGNTPAHVLRSLIYAFNSRDVETLDTALADDFTFYFDEDDVGKEVGQYIIPESWTLTDFLDAVGKVFNYAHTIDMEINTSNVGAPGDDDTIYFARDVEVELLVMVEAVNGYKAHGFCDFEFEDTVTGAGPDNWVVRNWWDDTAPVKSGDRNINQASIGFIMAVFR